MAILCRTLKIYFLFQSANVKKLAIVLEIRGFLKIWYLVIGSLFGRGYPRPTVDSMGKEYLR